MKPAHAHTRRLTIFLGAVVGAVALAGGCTGPQGWWHKDLREWQGAPLQEVLDAWGPPLRTVTGEGEGEELLLVYDRVRELDHRLEHLQDPGARLRSEQRVPAHVPRDRTDCLVYFEIEDDRVAAVRHEGAICDIVPRDPRRRRADPEPRRAR